MKKFRIVKHTNSVTGKNRYSVEHKVLNLWWSKEWHWYDGGQDMAWSSTLEQAEDSIEAWKRDYALKKSHTVKKILPR